MRRRLYCINYSKQQAFLFVDIGKSGQKLIHSVKNGLAILRSAMPTARNIQQYNNVEIKDETHTINKNCCRCSKRILKMARAE